MKYATRTLSIITFVIWFLAFLLMIYFIKDIDRAILENQQIESPDQAAGQIIVAPIFVTAKLMCIIGATYFGVGALIHLIDIILSFVCKDRISLIVFGVLTLLTLDLITAILLFCYNPIKEVNEDQPFIE